MTATRWWSSSKQEWLVLEDIHDNHILNAARMLERGGYRVPVDDEPLGETQPPSELEAAHLKRTLDSEMQRRKIGPYNPAEPEPAPGDEGFA